MKSMLRLRSWASSMMMALYLRQQLVALDFGQQDAVGHQLDLGGAADLAGEADLEADFLADVDAQFSAMRSATVRAASRRGWVWPIRPFSPRPSSRHILGIWVVLPEPVSPVEQLGQRWREHADLTTRESLKVAAPTLAALSDQQVGELLAAVEKRAAQEKKKLQKLDDAEWREFRVKQATDRLDEWTDAVTPQQRERIVLWASQQKRPPADPQASRRKQFAELLKTRREPGFEQRLQTYAFEPFTGEIAEMNEPQTQASRQLLADLSGLLTAQQRAYLRDRFTDMAAQMDQLVAAK
jgi:hypothetical protein